MPELKVQRGQPSQRPQAWRDDVEFDAYQAKLDQINQASESRKDALSAALTTVFKRPENEPFEDMLRSIVASRGYFPGETDLSTVAFVEGARYLAMHILELGNVNLAARKGEPR